MMLNYLSLVTEPYGDVVSSQGVAQHLEIKSSSRPASPYSIHQGSGVVVQSNHPTHVVVLQPSQLTHGKGNRMGEFFFLSDNNDYGTYFVELNSCQCSLSILCYSFDIGVRA